MSRLDVRGDWDELARESHYRADLLAKKCSVSVRQLERFIRKKEGMSVHCWLNKLRQKRAALLLGEPKMIKEIAYELDYKQQSHFSRDFKDFYGVCPTSFRSKPKNVRNR